MFQGVDYFDVNALSKSGIDLLLKCPAYYKAWMDGLAEKKTKALDFGSLFHTLVLEPETFADRYVSSGLSMNTKAGKAFKASLAKDQKIVKEADVELALSMAEAVWSHRNVQFIFENYIAEKSIYWEKDGIICKAKPDMISTLANNVRIAVDLKTTEDASPHGIQRSVEKYAYYRQAPWYMDGLNAVGLTCDYFLFVFVEKKYPHLVTSCILDADAMQTGMSECEKAMSIYARCMEENVWPCYTMDTLTISLSKRR